MASISSILRIVLTPVPLPFSKKHTVELEKVQRNAVEMIKGMEQLIYWGMTK